MRVSPTNISGVLRLTPRQLSDARGVFSESWNKRTLEKVGVFLPDFVQDNHSLSNRVGTVRGLHYQAPPHAQGKLVRCGRGRIFDVAVDARVKSPTYGHWYGEELSFENGAQLWIPAGCLHGFMTLEPESEIIYKCTDYYASEADGAVRWDSAGIDWPLAVEPTLSAKDATAMTFGDWTSPFTSEFGGECI